MLARTFLESRPFNKAAVRESPNELAMEIEEEFPPLKSLPPRSLSKVVCVVDLLRSLGPWEDREEDPI